MLPEQRAAEIVQKMMDADQFSQWLGIEILESLPGTSAVRITLRSEMCNGFGIAHGGICYALADSALAFASNSHGMQAVSVETSISHIKKVSVGDVLTALAVEEHQSSKFGIYHVTVLNQHNEKVALFKGTVYKSGKTWNTDTL